MKKREAYLKIYSPKLINKYFRSMNITYNTSTKI